MEKVIAKEIPHRSVTLYGTFPRLFASFSPHNSLMLMEKEAGGDFSRARLPL
jgi:hypothetical protein